MKTYITHNMEGNKELLANLEMAKSEATAAQKLAKEGVCMLRKANEEKEMSQVEARRLVEEKATMVAKNEKTVWLRRELQYLRVGLATQNKDLEADYHKTTTTTSKLDLFFIYFIWLVMAWIFMPAQTMYALLSFFIQYECTY